MKTVKSRQAHLVGEGLQQAVGELVAAAHVDVAVDHADLVLEEALPLLWGEAPPGHVRGEHHLGGHSQFCGRTHLQRYTTLNTCS